MAKIFTFNPFTGTFDVVDDTVAPGSPIVNWGDITGTLTAQLDLQTELNGKADTAHTHVELDITDLDKYSQAEADALFADKLDKLLADETKLLLNFEGADGATPPLDDTGDHSVSYVGGTEIDDTEQKWGATSMFFPNGSPHYLTIPESNDFEIGVSLSDDWTFDTWMKNGTAVDRQFAIFYYRVNNSAQFGLRHSSGGYGLNMEWQSYNITDTHPITTGDAFAQILDQDWHHIAVCKVGDQIGLYLDGALIRHFQLNAINDLVAPTMYIGTRTTSSNYWGWNGWIQSFKIKYIWCKP